MKKLIINMIHLRQIQDQYRILSVTNQSSSHKHVFYLLLSIKMIIIISYPLSVLSLPSSPSTSSSYYLSEPDILLIRHERSRLRHSNEKDRMQWGLKILDNLTLEDYDTQITDGYDNDNSSIMLSLPKNNDFSLNSNTTNYNNTINYSNKIPNFMNFDYNSNGMTKIKIDFFKDNKNFHKKLKSIENNDESFINLKEKIHHSDFVDSDFRLTTHLPFETSSSIAKLIKKNNKFKKKKIMENIQKDINKGLEYLKLHTNLQNEHQIQSFSKQDGATNLNKNINYDNSDEKKSNLFEKIKYVNKNSQTIAKTEENQNNILPLQVLSPSPPHLLSIKKNSTQFNSKEPLHNNSTNRTVTTNRPILSSTKLLPLVFYYNKQQLIAQENNQVQLNKNNTKTLEINTDNDFHVDSNDATVIYSNFNQNHNKNNTNKTTQSNNPFRRNRKYLTSVNVTKNSHHIDSEIKVETIQKSTFNYTTNGHFKRHKNNNKVDSNYNEGDYNEKSNNNNNYYMSNVRYVMNDDAMINENAEHDFNNNDSSSSDSKMNEDDESMISTIDDNRNDEIEEDFKGGNEGYGDTDDILYSVYDGNDDDLSELDEISRNNRLNLLKGRDVVTKFLQIVESQHLLGANCTAGTALNLGEGVVDQYAQDRFRIEAEVAVNRANMLTRIFKSASLSVQSSEHLLHASVLSMVEFDDDIFAAGNCFDWNQHPAKKGLFCPFAYRLPPPDHGASFAKDLAAEYHYLGNTSEWFFLARKNAEKVIAKNEQYIKAYHLYSNSTSREVDEILSVKYEDGRWSKPYYDCGGGNIWMLTYTVPFFGYENGTYFFKGTSGIDIDLRRVDIDQCPQLNTPGTTQPLNIFAGTDKCKQRTTMCEAITGLGFRRGSYKCICRRGFYYPYTKSDQKYFNGSILEEEYEKLMLGEDSTYNKFLSYECLPCAEGCDSCEDSSPCVAELNWPMRTSILTLACAVIGFLPPATWFTFRYQKVKVVRAASPALLRVIALGAFFIYFTTIVMYPPPSLYTCTARIWLREIGFSLTYGALMLKTWRISVIFRVRSAKAVKITDAALLKRLGIMCGVVGACLLVRTIVSPPEVVVGRTADDLKAFLCKTDWWDYTFTSMEVLFLAWGVRLCIMVRKAPSEFNESRFISMAIYNEFLLTCFLNVSMIFLQSPANPDLLYIIFFCHTQLTVTLLLGLIFGSKVYIVMRSGKAQDSTIGMGAKSSGTKFNYRTQIRTFANPSTATTSTIQIADTKLSEQEALEEIRQLSVQLQRIQELAPPKGVAVMTISSLLDSLKMTSHQITLKTQQSSQQDIHAPSNLALIPLTCGDNLLKNNKLNETLKIDCKLDNLDIISNQICSNCYLKINDEAFKRKEQQQITKKKEFSDTQTSPVKFPKICTGNLSFPDLQLECICSSQPSNENNEHCYNVINNNNNNGNGNNMDQRFLSNIEENCRNLKGPICISSIETDAGEKSDNNNDGKLEKRCNLLKQSKSNNSSSSCDNSKSNEYYLSCDNFRSKFINNDLLNSDLDSSTFKSLVKGAKEPIAPHHHFYYHTPMKNDEDDISFHSSTSDELENNDTRSHTSSSTKNIVTAKTSSNKRKNDEADYCVTDNNEYQQQRKNTEDIKGSHSNISEPSNSKESNTKKGGKTRKNDKLALELNNRSKYTKEVSV